MSEITKVLYSDFGAVGDGVADDFAALRAAHEYANEHGSPVFAEPGKNYYIGNNGDAVITIRTDTNWTGATITVDDTVVKYTDPARNKNIFHIASENAFTVYDAQSDMVKAVVAAGGLKVGTVNIGYAPGRPMMMIPYDTEHKVYIRYGINASSGNDQHEVLIVDADGNLDKDTPILLSYDNISYIKMKAIDDAPITVEGGTFVTIANCSRCNYDYYSRAIAVNRSNVTMRGIEHKIVNEGPTGAPYAGFIVAYDLNNFLVEDCIFQAHRYYEEERVRDEEGNVVTWGSPMGTYELSGGNANKLRYVRCTQSNFYDKDGKPTGTWYDADWNTALNNKGEISGIWGVMGSNYCKNIEYDSCVLNRLDAHAGVYNTSVINTETITVSIIGGGTALIKDSTIYNHCMISLRGDYGSTWDGKIVLENAKWVTHSERPVMISGIYSNHYFGYDTNLPDIEIDGLTVETPADAVYVFGGYNLPAGADPEQPVIDLGEGPVENKNIMHYPRTIRILADKTNKPVIPAPEDSFFGQTIKVVG